MEQGIFESFTAWVKTDYHLTFILLSIWGIFIIYRIVIRSKKRKDKDNYDDGYVGGSRDSPSSPGFFNWFGGGSDCSNDSGGDCGGDGGGGGD